MGSTLLNTAIKDTYEGLIKTSDTSTVSGTAKYLSDGAGNDSALSVSTTAVGIGNATPAKALDVTGSVRASQGILFGTDTASANTLNDYEEGTFTPFIVGSSTDGSATYGVANGEYTKIGNTVYVQVYITWSSGTGTGSLRIDGLPFTIVNSGASYSFPVFYVADAKFSYSAGTMISGEGQLSTTTIAFVELPVGGGTRGDVAYVADGTIVLSGTYLTAE